MPTEKAKFPRKNGQRYVHLVNEFLFTLYAFDRSFAFAFLFFPVLEYHSGEVVI